jgi:hypothetical protein
MREMGRSGSGSLVGEPSRSTRPRVLRDTRVLRPPVPRPVSRLVRRHCGEERVWSVVNGNVRTVDDHDRPSASRSRSPASRTHPPRG